jgi:hypothetical protein
MQRQHRLLLLALDRHRLDPRLLYGHPNPARIRRIVLVANHKWLDHPTRQQFDLVTELPQRAPPVLRASARLHADQTARSVRKMLQKLLPLKLQRHNLTRLTFHPMQLKHPLCDIHSHHATIHVGPSGCL